jgi:hypothetical protein
METRENSGAIVSASFSLSKSSSAPQFLDYESMARTRTTNFMHCWPLSRQALQGRNAGSTNLCPLAEYSLYTCLSLKHCWRNDLQLHVDGTIPFIAGVCLKQPKHTWVSLIMSSNDCLVVILSPLPGFSFSKRSCGNSHHIGGKFSHKLVNLPLLLMNISAE